MIKGGRFFWGGCLKMGAYMGGCGVYPYEGLQGIVLGETANFREELRVFD